MHYILLAWSIGGVCICAALCALIEHGKRKQARWDRADELEWMNADKAAYWAGHFPNAK